MTSSNVSKTQVGIIGAGPAGLLLARILQLNGIESVILERRSRAYVLARVRAGVLEQGSVDTLIQYGAGERLKRESLPHESFQLRWDGKCVFRRNVTSDFGIVTGHFGHRDRRSISAHRDRPFR